MVNLEIKDDSLIIEPRGLYKVLALRSRITVPLSNIESVEAAPQKGKGFYRGIRAPGTYVPGLIVAGTYYKDKVKTFWLISRGRNAIRIELKNEDYDCLVVEVDSPEESIARLIQAIDRQGHLQQQ